MAGAVHADPGLQFAHGARRKKVIYAVQSRFDPLLLTGESIEDTETFTEVSIKAVKEMRDRIDLVWQMFIDQQNGLFVMGKQDYDNLPAVAADVLRIIAAEYKNQKKET